VSGMSKWIHMIERLESNLFQYTQKENTIESVLDKVKLSLDQKENTLLLVERYVDVYMPIRV